MSCYKEPLTADEQRRIPLG